VQGGIEGRADFVAFGCGDEIVFVLGVHQDLNCPFSCSKSTVTTISVTRSK
jgi:hypothetical protein